MAYDEKLAARVRTVLYSERAVDEIKMFGGICFKVDGHMACGVLNDGLIIKCAKEDHDDLLAKPNTKPFDFTGKPMRGILVVTPAGVKTPATLKKWIAEGIASAKAKAAAGSVSRRRKKTKRKPWPKNSKKKGIR